MAVGVLQSAFRRFSEGLPAKASWPFGPRGDRVWRDGGKLTALVSNLHHLTVQMQHRDTQRYLLINAKQQKIVEKLPSVETDTHVNRSGNIANSRGRFTVQKNNTSQMRLIK